MDILSPKFLIPLGIGAALIVIAVRFSGSGGEELKSATPAQISSSELKGDHLGFLAPRGIGNIPSGQPWVTDLTISDLDQDGLLDVVVSEGRMNQVSWIRQYPVGIYEEFVIGAPIAGAAHVEVVDIDKDGDRDVLVAGMGIVTPNDQKIGSVVILENNGQQGFSNRVLLDKVDRVTYVGAADFDMDGDLDLSVGQFGYFEGEVRWMENVGDLQFTSHSLLSLSGTIHAPAADFDADGDLDIIALVSQDWEEIYAFENDGTGDFSNRVIYGSTDKDFGSSGISIADIDLDGDPDIAYTNGDGFDYATPGSRTWHGVQWLENDGAGKFEYRRIGDLSGSYSPLVIDIDSDGDLDVVAVSGFNEWTKPDAVSLMYFENQGGEAFEPRVLAYEPTHLVVVDGADMDGDGDVELVTGGFHFYPPYDRVSRVSIWE